ncbi:MAG: prepilin-type N-terminal cleavage/methylation domain-containing protein [Patescibacteria group bacterium]|nr:prepilin-type N-terminal cleavage/methylation domain-containing protein [Patescibacteria group bacterium]MDE2015838.1 prepilin-type N-terminal cleavage/methylation domain-containing protein [Patescibacteria group bacterium]MDE2227213.1 prepilin-type N-terminal cleavage/methylation domain-containing protein [Patescibacteria group bacterium]
MTNERGFTLIELVVVIALLAIIFGYVLQIGYQFYASQVLVSERDSIVNLLHRARSLALDNYNQANHGLYITDASYTVFQGNSYAARNADFDEVFNRAGGISLSGPSEIVFSAINGSSNVSGTMAFYNNTGGFSVSVNGEGRINW